MNWKAEAKDKLRKYATMQTSICSIPQEIDRLEAELTAIRSARTDSAPVGGGKSARENAIINNIAQRQELEAALKNASAWVRIVDHALESLREEERLILEALYICPRKGEVDLLCEKLELEKSSIYRRRDLALQSFTLALYGITGEELSAD